MLRQAAAQPRIFSPTPVLSRAPYAVQRKCGCGGSSGLSGSCSECQKKELIGRSLQTKLRINEPGDEYEREADRVAARVMQMADDESNVSVQRTVSRTEVADQVENLQRQEATNEPAPAENTPPSETPSEKEEEESSCPSWRGDPESITKRAGEFYARNHLTPPSQATVERIDR